MRKKDVEKILEASGKRLVPDVLEKIKNNDAELFSSIVFGTSEKPKRKSMPLALKRAVFAVCAVAVVFLAMFGAFFYIEADYSYIYIDINPSVEIVTKKDGSVKKLNALNDDGAHLINFDYRGLDVEFVVDTILFKAIELGYIKKDGGNEILISVLGKDSDRESKIMDKLYEKIEKRLKADNIKADVLKQRISKNDKDRADKLKISAGKLKLIEKIIELDPSKTIEGLKDKSVKELQAIYRYLLKNG